MVKKNQKINQPKRKTKMWTLLHHEELNKRIYEVFPQMKKGDTCNGVEFDLQTGSLKIYVENAIGELITYYPLMAKRFQAFTYIMGLTDSFND